MPASERQTEALRLRKEGVSRAEIARRFNISERAVKGLLERARRWEEAPEGQKEAIAAAGLDIGSARYGWRVIPREDGGRESVFWRSEDSEDRTESIIEAIREGLGVLAPPPSVEPPMAPADLMAVFPVADLHMGLLTCAEEVGEDWDTRIAQKVFSESLGKLISVTPDAGTALIAQLGDLLHIDDFTNQTPANKHFLDADTRYFVVLKRAVAAMKMAIEALRQKYPHVIYASVPGNHDYTSAHAITIGLQEAYRDVAEVEVIPNFGPHHMMEWGHNMLLLTHGDKAPPDRIVHFAAAQWPETWGRTRHRVALSGHVHHQSRKEVGGMAVETFGTIVPRDAYSYGHAYSGSRQLVSLTFDRDAGEVSRSRVVIESLAA